MEISARSNPKELEQFKNWNHVENAPTAMEANSKNTKLDVNSNYSIDISRGAIERDTFEFVDISQYSDIYDIVEQEAYYIGLDPVLAKVLIDAESSFRHNAHNTNRGSYDSGPAQINNRGEPLLFYLGKELTLADGRTVTVNRTNYKTDARLNVAMGLRRYKAYMADVGGDPFAAYAVYNIGGSITKVVKGKKGAVDVITAVRRSGNQQGANNLKNNYWPKYNKWTGGN